MSVSTAPAHSQVKNLYQKPLFFITGNSRSGTTMMMRIMNNHPEVHSINEPHFFEKMWSPGDEGKVIDRDTAAALYAKLFTGQRDGFFEPVKMHRHKYEAEIAQRLALYSNPPTRQDVYTDFVHYEAGQSGKKIPCEKTPQNIFYIEEILRLYPEARIINMVRDPRGVMLSQKKKWKRKYLGADFLTSREMLRLRINYHPITISRLWNAAIAAGNRWENHPRVFMLRFEDLVKAPEETCTKVCAFLGIHYDPAMLLVPHAGSSTEADNSSELGIRKPKSRSWKEKGLNDAEVHLCQEICRQGMEKYGYKPVEVKPGTALVGAYYAAFPFKVGLALLFNLRRMRSIADTLKRRMGRK